MAIVDYVSGVIQTKSIEEVLQYAQNLFPSWSSGKGAHGYSSAWIAPGFRLFHGGQPGMGVYFQASGEGCATISEAEEFEGWDKFLEGFVGYGFRPSRIDLAFDDRAGLLDLPEIGRKLLDEECTTRYRSVSPQSTLVSGELTRSCIYLGTMASDSSVCIYDKRLERIQAGEADPGHWVRVELRYKHKQAESVVSWIIGNVGLAGADSLLAAGIEFREPSEETNKARWEVSQWWQDFRRNSEKVCRTVPKVIRTIEEHVQRFTHQHAATLCMLVLAMCGGCFQGPWLDSLMYKGFDRMSKAQHETVEKHLGLTRSMTRPITPYGKGLGL